jgi:hypothetical protein
LGEQSGRQIRSSSGDEDGVERGVGAETECAVCGEHLDVGIAELGEKVTGTVRQGRVAFNGENLRS